MNTLIPISMSGKREFEAMHFSKAVRAKIGALIVLSGLSTLVSGCATPMAQAPPPAAPVAPPAPYNGPTLCKVLGVPDAVAAGKECCTKVQTCLKRQFPGAGAPPNLGPVDAKSSPAVKCAAEILAAEAEVPQKIDALRYLGRVGCTKCYPCVEDGLIAALDDCSEVVRFEAAKAIRSTATEQCNCCQCTSCCTKRIHDKLYKVAFESKCDGCPVECSSRVRRVARQALCMCGGPGTDTAAEQEPTPSEGPKGQVAPAKAPVDTPPTAAPAASPSAATNAKNTAADKKEPAVPPQPEASKGAGIDSNSSQPSDLHRPLATPPDVMANNNGRAAGNDVASNASVSHNGCRTCGTKEGPLEQPSNPFQENSDAQSVAEPPLGGHPSQQY